MIKGAAIMDIKSLARKGHTIRDISRMTGIHRNTIKKYLNEDSKPVYRKKNRNSILDPYKDLITGWLEQQNYQATRIYELLQGEGYVGSYNVVKLFVRGVKEQRERIAYTRFETVPGQQAQVDFADMQVQEPDGTTKTIYAFIMTLGYSRHQYVEYIEDCTMPNFLACHQHAFAFLGGIPAELVYDNMKNVVIRRLVGKVQWNREFEAFAIHYGFKPIATSAYSPWSKGKVERPIHYLRERFWRGYNFTSIDQANADVRIWLNTTAKERLHGTHRQKVADRYENERRSLGSLPAVAYDISAKCVRKVHKDCTISFDGNLYVVNHELVGKKVCLRIRKGVLRIFDDERLVTIYRLAQGKGHLIAHPHFYERLKNDKEQAARKYHRSAGKGKATRGLVGDALKFEVMTRSLDVYQQEVI